MIEASEAIPSLASLAAPVILVAARPHRRAPGSPP
jgi:hypothetical protein